MLGNDPRVRELVRCLVDVEDILPRANLTFVNEQGMTQNFDLVSNVGRRLGVIVGMYVYWYIKLDNDQELINGGYEPNSIPDLGLYEPSQPIQGQVEDMAFTITVDGFVIVGSSVVGRGETCNHCLSMVLNHYNQRQSMRTDTAFTAV